MRERDNDERESLLSGLVDNRSAVVSSASTAVQFRPSATLVALLHAFHRLHRTYALLFPAN